MEKFMKLFVFCVLLTTSINAYAYLDPGTGSMLLQVILGGIAALGVALKLFWHKIMVAIGRCGRKTQKNETNLKNQ